MKIIALIVLCSMSAQAGVVASTLWLECRGELAEGRMAVASVIWNRAKSRVRTVDQICLQPKQFSCWNERSADWRPEPKTKRERELYEEFLEIERQMRAGTFTPSGSWTHYHTLKVDPFWSAGMKSKTVIGNHLFGITK